jgi:phenylacetate-CoA ligase
MKYRKYHNLAFAENCEIRNIQNKMLQEHLQLLMRSSQFYQKHLKKSNITDITIDKLHTLPTTSKKDIENHNSDFLICDKDDIAEIVRSSGTSGKPTKIVYTQNDIKRLKYNEHQALTHCEIRRSDTVLLTCTMDRCFIAGLAYFLGSHSIGATVIRNGANTIESHLELIRDLKPNVIIGVPSFLLKLAKFAGKSTDPTALGIEKLVCIGEPLRLWKDGRLKTTELCSKIEKLWEAKAFSTYASTEMVTAFCECRKQEGGHLIPELAIVEILDESGTPLPPGETGEVTITPFHFEAMPLLRYRTGDMATIIADKCECGRNSLRISGISGRKYQMIKCKGTTFYPTAVNAVLDGMDCVIEYQLRVKNSNLSDSVSLAIALTESAKFAEVETALQTALRVKIEIQEEDIATLIKKVFPPGARKPKRVVINN